ncbi:MAG: phosphohydrolase [Anaerolineae bacterium]|nr:phosphohydrolase [Anaerolineae bacterium]
MDSALTPDFARAQAYVFRRLSEELPDDLFYHAAHHTRDDVMLAAERLAALADLSRPEKLLLRTAALYHDLGFIERFERNEPVAVRIAEETLPGFGYTPAQIAAIGGMIMATQMPQSPRSLPAALLCDADLDSLGRDDFMATSHCLWVELLAHGQRSTLEEWYDTQVAFLTGHTYFTAQARMLRGPGKAANIRRVTALLHDLRSGRLSEDALLDQVVQSIRKLRDAPSDCIRHYFLTLGRDPATPCVL